MQADLAFLKMLSAHRLPNTLASPHLKSLILLGLHH